MGAVPFLFFVAEIMYIEAVDDHPDYEFQVGCRITRRVSRPRPARE